jgi:hypothetical protein
MHGSRRYQERGEFNQESIKKLDNMTLIMGVGEGNEKYKKPPYVRKA